MTAGVVWARKAARRGRLCACSLRFGLRGTSRDRCWPVTALRSLLECLQRFLRGHERRGLNSLAGATARKRHGNRRGAHVVRQFGNHDYVVLSKGKPGGFDLASQLFNRGPYRLDAVLGMRQQRLPPLVGIGDLVKIMWHRASFDSLAERMISEAEYQVKRRG